jgi:hypothetical protein
LQGSYWPVSWWWVSWRPPILVRQAGPPDRDVKFFYIIPLSDMLIFATLIFFAFRARCNPSAPKRLILVATVALMTTALARWPIGLIHRKAPAAALASCIFLMMLMAYDLWSTRKIHRATAWASAFLVFLHEIRLPMGKTEAWHAFASWVQSVAR